MHSAQDDGQPQIQDNSGNIEGPSDALEAEGEGVESIDAFLEGTTSTTSWRCWIQHCLSTSLCTIEQMCALDKPSPLLQPSPLELVALVLR